MVTLIVLIINYEFQKLKHVFAIEEMFSFNLSTREDTII
jgi:hypothetical protein